MKKILFRSLTAGFLLFAGSGLHAQDSSRVSAALSASMWQSGDTSNAVQHKLLPPDQEGVQELQMQFRPSNKPSEEWVVVIRLLNLKQNLKKGEVKQMNLFKPIIPDRGEWEQDGPGSLKNEVNTTRDIIKILKIANKAHFDMRVAVRTPDGEEVWKPSDANLEIVDVDESAGTLLVRWSFDAKKRESRKKRTDYDRLICGGVVAAWKYVPFLKEANRMSIIAN